MDTPLEIRYSGVVVGHGSEVRDRDADRLFLVCSDPMPVGTTIEIALDGVPTVALVDSVVESSDPASCGMRLRLQGRAERAAAPEAVAQDAPAAASPEFSEAVAADDAAGDDAGDGAAAPGGDAQTAQQGGSRKRRRRRR